MYVHTRAMGMIDQHTGTLHEGFLPRTQTESVSCDYFNASQGVSFHSNMLQEDRDIGTFIFECTKLFSPSFFGDDLVISNYFASKNIPIVALTATSDKSPEVQFTEASAAPDSLEKGASGQCSRNNLYRDIMQHLQKHNFWFIHNDEDDEALGKF